MIIRGSDLAGNVQVPIQVAVGVFYGIPSAAVLAGAIIAVRVRLHDLPRLGSTVRAMTVLLPLTAVVITPITMGFAWTTQYSSSTPIVLIEVALVAGALAGAIVLARRWALRGRPLPAPVTV